MKGPVSFICSCVVLLTIFSCSSTNRLTMGVVEPAQITLASDITKIGIINRSLPSESNKAIDEIDKILSLEGLNFDKEGAEFAVTGLLDELSRNNRFESVKLIETNEDHRKGLAVFPAALPWETVEKICEENDVDVLFSLAFFDTDTNADYQMTEVTVPNNLGVKVKVPGHRITLNTVVKNGWRIYDPVGKRILDEYTSKNYVTSTGEGINPVRALEAVVGRKEGVMQISSNLGNNYGLNVKPLSRRVSRDYFVRGTDNFVVAMRRARAGDWNGAAELWEKELNNPKAKVAGRAYYNMAIINEINGNLEKAMKMASTSYTDYNNSIALKYINILKRRIGDQQVLNQQLAK
ncbi:DUF6340 family protein [Maribacter thermophilus]|uniref:DUF6340 family protein n=1 Tax=Maribacter thermophilus TaxID=1197874 RepID=UPI000640D953|nr:DUF6340 family protein [Maribacter thermophilus]